jgi:hypothetical protein
MHHLGRPALPLSLAVLLPALHYCFITLTHTTLVQLVASSVLRHHTCAELMALVEVVMDLGRPPLARFGGEARDVRLGEAAVAPEDLQYAMGQVGADGTLRPQLSQSFDPSPQ